MKWNYHHWDWEIYIHPSFQNRVMDFFQWLSQATVINPWAPPGCLPKDDHIKQHVEAPVFKALCVSRLHLMTSPHLLVSPPCIFPTTRTCLLHSTKCSRTAQFVTVLDDVQMLLPPSPSRGGMAGSNGWKCRPYNVNRPKSTSFLASPVGQTSETVNMIQASAMRAFTLLIRGINRTDLSQG